MSETPLLGLPLLEAAQAQKHVTHNEALLLLDAAIHLSVITRTLTAPPATPADGDRYLVATAASGDWAGHDGAIAFREAGAWRFATARKGWRLWLEDEQLLLVYTGTLWHDIAAIAALQGMSLLGVNATADATNKLAVKSSAVLLDNIGNGTQLKINKHAAADTGSLLYQTNYSGRAEMGLVGDDDFHVKVSPDGSAWLDAITVNRTTGVVSLPHTPATGVNDGDKGDIAVTGSGVTWTLKDTRVKPQHLAQDEQGFWPDVTSSTRVWKFRDRLFVGDAVDHSGNLSAPYGTDWLSTDWNDGGLDWLMINAQFAVQSVNGRIAVLGASRSSGGGGDSIGTAGVVMVDGVGPGWALYGDARKKPSGAGHPMYGMELAVKNQSVNVTMDPYGQSIPADPTIMIHLQAGGDGSVGGVATAPTSAGINFGHGQNHSGGPATLNTGIVFASNALTPDGSGNSIAMALAKNQALVWYSAYNIRSTEIRSDVVTAGHGLSAIFGDDLLTLKGSSGDTTMATFTNVASAVNHLDIANAAAADYPKLRALGSNTDIGIFYHSKGAGAHRFMSNDGTIELFRAEHVASAVNFLSARPNIAGNPPGLYAFGTDTNINIRVQPKGTGTFVSSGTIVAPAATSSIASLNAPHGVAPTAPVNGDLWTTTAGFFARVNGATASLAGSNTGDQTITLTGDVTGSGTGSFATAIAANAVSNAKLATMATLTIKGNNTGGAAAPIDLTAAQVKTLLAIASTDVSGLGSLATASSVNLSTQATGTLQAAQVPAYTGDVTSAGGALALTIAANAVTNAKLATMATLTIKGNNTGGAAAPIDLTAAQVKTLLAIANTDVSGLGSLATASSVNLSTQATGTLQAAQEPAHTGDVTNTAGSLATTIAANAVSNAKLAQMAANTIKGNNTGALANAADLTMAQVKTLLAIIAADIADATASGRALLTAADINAQHKALGLWGRKLATNLILS